MFYAIVSKTFFSLVSIYHLIKLYIVSNPIDVLQQTTYYGNSGNKINQFHHKYITILSATTFKH